MLINKDVVNKSMVDGFDLMVGMEQEVEVSVTKSDIDKAREYRELIERNRLVAGYAPNVVSTDVSVTVK